MSDLKKRGGRPPKNQTQAPGRDRPTQDKEAAEQQRAAQEAGKRTRADRVPMGRYRKLDHKIPDGYIGRWVKDIDNRLEQFKQAGYEFVHNADGGKKTLLSGGEKLFLMMIKEEWYREDYEAQQNRVNDLVKAKVQGLDKDEYLPEGHTSALMKDKDLPI